MAKIVGQIFWRLVEIALIGYATLLSLRSQYAHGSFVLLTALYVHHIVIAKENDK